MVNQYLSQGLRPECLVGDSGQKLISGSAMTLGKWGMIVPGFRVRITGEGAFEGAFSDYVLNTFEHHSAPLARNKAGNFEMSAKGWEIPYEAVVNQQDSDFVNVFERVQSGVIDGSSIGFHVSKKGYKDDLDKETGLISRTITNVENVFELTLTHRPVMKSSTAIAKTLKSVDPSMLDDQLKILGKRAPDKTKLFETLRTLIGLER